MELNVDMEDLQFRVVESEEAKHILEHVEEVTNNNRFMLCQFEKYIDKSDILWYGCFENSHCMALAALKKYVDDRVILLAEVQSIIKGYGKSLICSILSNFKNVWWCADPLNGDKNLVKYYQQFNVKQYLIKMSKWTDTPEYAFYKADAEHEKIILSILSKADKTSKDYNPNIL